MKKVFTSNRRLHNFQLQQGIFGFILGTALLLAACANPAIPPAGTGAATAPGTGQVRIIFTYGAARTIYPAMEFHHCVYTFTTVPGGVSSVLTPNAGVFTLTANETYTLHVDAYATASADSLAARGDTASSFTVDASGNIPAINVTLTPWVTEGTGTLRYTIHYPAGASIRTLTWGPMGGAPALSLPAYGSGVQGTKGPVNAGYYALSVSLRDAAGKTVGKREVVHIYKNMTTDAAFSFSGEDFTASFDNTDLGVYKGTETSPQANTGTLALALAWLKNNAAASTNYTIKIGADESLPPWTLGGSTAGTTTAADGLTDVKVTIKGKDTEWLVGLDGTGSLLTVRSGVTLVLDENITLVGKNNNTASLVLVDGGILEMGKNTKITGNSIFRSSPAIYGGGVSVNNGGTFTMNDSALVSGNTDSTSHAQAYGGGVSVSGSGSAFTMNDYASVSGNTVGTTGTHSPSLTYGGGVYVGASGTLTMNDHASVSGNTAANNTDSTAYAYGGGVSVNSGTLTMNDDATVSGNTGKTSGGGVHVASGSTLTMNDNASVSGNTVSTDVVSSGGGVYVTSSTFTMNGSASVSGNTGKQGGGVFVNGSTFTMNNSAEVSGNTATHSGSASTRTWGGGVYVYSNGIFIMNGTSEVWGNTAYAWNSNPYSAECDGGGVYLLWQASSFTMNGGTIYGAVVPSPNAHKANKVAVNGTFMSTSGASSLVRKIEMGNGPGPTLRYSDDSNIISSSTWGTDATLTGH
jgi:hypothetical protein